MKSPKTSTNFYNNNKVFYPVYCILEVYVKVEHHNDYAVNKFQFSQRQQKKTSVRFRLEMCV